MKQINSSSTRTLKLENEYGSVKIDSINKHPQTISLEFVTNITIKNDKSINHDNIVEYLSELYSKTSSTIFARNHHHLNDCLLHPSLRNDVIIINQFIDEESKGYLLGKIKKKKAFIFKFEIYIHTSNCIEPNSCFIKFCKQEYKNNENTKCLIDFCEKVLTDELLVNNEKFYAKILQRNRK